MSIAASSHLLIYFMNEGNMARKQPTESKQKPIEQYDHKDKQRLNNPPVGLVDARTDNGGMKKKKWKIILDGPHERMYIEY